MYVRSRFLIRMIVNILQVSQGKKKPAKRRRKGAGKGKPRTVASAVAGTRKKRVRKLPLAPTRKLLPRECKNGEKVAL